MNFKNIVTLTKIQDITNICNFLFYTTPVNFFHYFRTYNDGGVCSLTSNGTWFENWLNKKYYEISSFCMNPGYTVNKYTFTDSLNISSPIVKDALEGYQIGPGLIITKPQIEFCEFFLFCVNPNCKFSAEFFLNNLDVFEKFIVFFKDKSMKIIKMHEKQKLYFPSPIMSLNDEKNACKNIKIALEPKHYYITDDNYLTTRELECINWLEKGKSYEEISCILNRSARTIERHIENAKIKMGVNKVLSLVVEAKKLKFI